MVRRLNPFIKQGETTHGKTEIIIRVDNGEDKYYYEWVIDKF